MPVRIDALADYISLNSSGLPTFTNYTVIFWEQVVTDNASTNRVSYLLQNASFSATHKLARAGDNVDRAYTEGGGSANLSANLSTTEWVMWALTCQGTGASDMKVYAWNASDANGAYKSATLQGSAPTGGISGWAIGSNFGFSEYRNARYCFVKVWDAVLSLAELQAERAQGSPVRTSNINRYHRLQTASDTSDGSGNGRTVTFNGTITTEGTEPVPWIASSVTLTDVDGDENIRSDQTGVVTTTTGAGASKGAGGITLRQNSVVSTQTDTAWSATTQTFSVVQGNVKYGAATLRVTENTGVYGELSITLSPPSGHSYIDLVSVHPSASQRISSTADLAAGDQIHARGVGGGAIPTGLTLNNDGSFYFTAGNTPVNFEVRIWDASDQTWGAWATQTVTTFKAHRVPAVANSSG